MASNVIRALHVDDDEVTSKVFGSKSLKAASADATSVQVDGVSGFYEIPDAGAALALGVKRAQVSKYAMPNRQGDLVASDAAAGIISVQNTWGSDLMILRLEVDLTTAATGACTADFGVAATAVSADSLMDGLNLQPTPVGPFDSIDDQGTNGQSVLKWPDGQFVTGSMASGATAGIVGTFTIWFTDMN